jgi:hypothetical protein
VFFPHIHAVVPCPGVNVDTQSGGNAERSHVFGSDFISVRRKSKAHNKRCRDDGPEELTAI